MRRIWLTEGRGRLLALTLAAASILPFTGASAAHDEDDGGPNGVGYRCEGVAVPRGRITFCRRRRRTSGRDRGSRG